MSIHDLFLDLIKQKSQSNKRTFPCVKLQRNNTQLCRNFIILLYLSSLLDKNVRLKDVVRSRVVASWGLFAIPLTPTPHLKF